MLLSCPLGFYLLCATISLLLDSNFLKKGLSPSTKFWRCSAVCSQAFTLVSICGQYSAVARSHQASELSFLPLPALSPHIGRQQGFLFCDSDTFFALWKVFAFPLSRIVPQETKC